jgi:uncharacterized protein (TIGR02271 family)
MVQEDESTYSLKARFDDLPPAEGVANGRACEDEGLRGPDSLHVEQTVIPVIAEEAQIRKERVVTGKVRLRKIVHHEQQTVDEPLLKEGVSVERVAIDRWVDEAPPIRNEGETLIVPVIEEVLVVEKRLRLREEVRLTWRHEEEHEPQHLVVRREEVRVERVPTDEYVDEDPSQEYASQEYPSQTKEDSKPAGAGTGDAEP